jgi:pyruvate carboxylase
VDFDKEFAVFREKFGNEVSFTDLLSYLLYPKVFTEYFEKRKEYGDVWHIPTLNFFYGLKDDEEVLVEIDKGKSILVRLLTCSDADAEGKKKVFMRLNGQTRIVEVVDRSVKITAKENQKAEKTDPTHIAAPLQGKLSQVMVNAGDEVKTNQPLFVIEAMKMETTITASRSGKISKIVVGPGTMVSPDDLIIIME